MEYTKGKWGRHSAPNGYHIWVGDTHIADVGNKEDAEQSANAHLIASAPDMYEALQVVLGYAESLRNNMLAELANPQEGTRTAEEYIRQMQNAYNALAKAEGRNA